MERDEAVPEFDSLEDAAEFFGWSPDLVETIRREMWLTDPRIDNGKV